jgi:predicted transcriptional regulator
MASNSGKEDLLSWTTQIISSHLRNNSVALSELPDAIKEVYRSLESVAGASAAPQDHRPAVSVRRSVTPEYIVCLEDGKKLKMLKRHLRTAYNMTPEEYRLKWGLPADYPMVSPNYARQRSSLAKKIGLGNSRRPRANSA